MLRVLGRGLLVRLGVLYAGSIGPFRGKAGPGNQKDEGEDQSANDVILERAPLIGPDQYVPEQTSGFGHLARILPAA